MAFSSISLNFAQTVQDGDFISFKYRRQDLTGDFFVLSEIAAPVRTVATVFEISTIGMFDQAELYKTAFALDYNGTGIFTVQRVLENVVITFVNDGYEFYDFTSTGDRVSVGIITVPESTFEILSDVVTEADADKCTDFKYTITANELISKYRFIPGGLEQNNVADPLVLAVPRGVYDSIKLTNAANDNITISIPDIGVLAVNNTTVNVSTLLNGGTVTVVVDFATNLDLEYSLNDADWVASNVFTGQADGNYTVYIRDQYGCKISKDYIVSAKGTRAPYFFVSKANSIGFMEQVDHNSCSLPRNSRNTLAYQSLVNLNGINYCLETLFQTCDDTTIQIHTNFDDTIVKVRREDLTEVTIPTTTKTSNLNKFAKMDCRKYAYNGQLAIYFDTGDVYNEIDEVTGTYALNGALPDMAIIGNQVQIGVVGTFTILDLFYEESVGKKVMLLNTSYSGANELTTAMSVYDLLPFEVVEFTIDWEAIGAGIVDVHIQSNDETNDTLDYLSENIDVAEEHINTLGIRYYGNNNRDVFYKYGIEHFIRIPYIGMEPKLKDENEINIGDLTIEVVNSDVYRVKEFAFNAVLEDRMNTLAIALSMDNVFIQDIGYAKDGTVDPGHIRGTNLCEVVCDMIETNVMYTNNKQGQEGENADSIPFNIPTIITTGTEFIKA